MAATPYQAIDLPVLADQATVPADLTIVAEELEERCIMRFADAAARDAAISVPVEGMVAWLSSVKRLTNYDGTVWKDTGTNVPSLHIAAIDSVNNGARLDLEGAGSHLDWRVTVFQNTYRLNYDPAGANSNVIQFTSLLETRMAGDAFIKGTRVPRTFISTVGPTPADGENGDLWVEW